MVMYDESQLCHIKTDVWVYNSIVKTAILDTYPSVIKCGNMGNPLKSTRNRGFQVGKSAMFIVYFPARHV